MSGPINSAREVRSDSLLPRAAQPLPGANPLENTLSNVGSAGSASLGNSNSLELGIAGIPAKTCDLIVGSLYALKASTSSARFPLFASLVLNAIRAGRKCFVITANKPDEFLIRLESYWSINAASLIADGQLCVFSTQAEVSKKIFRYGADRFVQELASFEVGINSFLLYDQADDLLSLHDPFLARQQVEVLAKWFQTNQVTALFSFSRPSDRQSDTFNTLMDYFTGIARLGGDKDGLELTFQYWQATRGAAVAKNYLLHTEDDGLYVAVEAEKPAMRTATAPAIVDDRRVAPGLANNEPEQLPFDEPRLCLIYNDVALDSILLSAPVSPIRVSSVQEIVSNACQQKNALILLNVAGISDLRKVAQVVHHIRLNLSSTMQLVAYGRQPEFSLEESQLLLRCGANVAIALQLSPASLSSFIDNIKRQVFVRAVDSDFSQIWQRYELERHAVSELGQPVEQAEVAQYAYRNPRAFVSVAPAQNNKKMASKATRSHYPKKVVEENS